MATALCGACGTENPLGFKFCGQCGAGLAAGCPSCGFVNPEGFRFCGECGTSLAGELATPPPAPAATQDERKLATVLFADVVGFTSLAENADPETVARVVDAAFRRMGEVVASHGGTVDKYMGDCLMAVFGVPQAHDDDAERAIAAGLAMRGLGGDLAFSIGINTGEVMVASVGRDQDATVMGDTVNVAARLEKAAGPGEVLVGPLTAQLAADQVTLLERDSLLLKGKRERVEVFEAIAIRGRDDALAVREVPPLVGRDDELAFLQSLWRRVRRDGQVGVVMVTGEAGVGKTRLVDELIHDVTSDALIARASYPAYGGLGGPRVAADIIRQLGQSSDPDVDARVQAIAGDIDPSLRALDPSAMQAEQAWAFRKLLLEKGEDQPLVIVIDDIHRSGDQTLEVLQKLASRVVEVPLLLVLAGRPEPGEWLTSFPSATTVRLAPLGMADARALADALVPDLPLGAEAAASLVERSGGNPLYLRELVNVVRAQGGLVAKEGEHDLAGGVALPPSLRAVLAARLDALPADDKAALQHVAVLGDAAREDHVRALGLDNAGSALTSLVRAGLLRFTGDGRFDIIDPLLREVAYETLPRQARGTRHRQAAAVADNAVETARHLDRATGYLPDDTELAGEAATALAKAGCDLLAAHRENDGVTLLRRAVELGLSDPGPLLELARALANNGKGTEAEEGLARLDSQLLTPEQLAERAQIEAVCVMWRDAERAVRLLEESAERWRELGNKAKEGWARSNKGVALFNLGRMPEAAVTLEASLDCFRDAGEIDGLQGRLAASSFLGLMRPEDPRVPEWLGEALRHAEAVGDRSNQTNTLVLLAWHHTFRCHQGGEIETAVAEGMARRAAELSLDLGFAEFAAHGWAIGATHARFTGRIDEAAALVERVSHLDLPPHSGIGHLARSVEFSVCLARAQHAESHTPPSIESPDPVAWMGWVIGVESLVLAGRIDEALEWMDTSQGPSMGALDGMLTAWPRGLALVLAGLPSDAQVHLEEALRSAELVKAWPSEVGSRALLAEVAFRAGDVDGVEKQLAAIGDRLPGGIAGALVHRVEALLDVDGAIDALRADAEELFAPGLLLAIEGTISSPKLL